MVAFGRNRPKWAYLAKKCQILVKKSNLRISPRNMFLCQKWGTFIVAFGRNRPKWAYLAQNGQILVKKSPKSKFWEFSPEKNNKTWAHWVYIYIYIPYNKWGIKKFPMIFKSKYERNWDFELFLVKQHQKKWIWEFPPQKKLGHFLKDQKICFYAKK